MFFRNRRLSHWRRNPDPDYVQATDSMTPMGKMPARFNGTGQGPVDTHCYVACAYISKRANMVVTPTYAVPAYMTASATFCMIPTTGMPMRKEKNR